MKKLSYLICILFISLYCLNPLTATLPEIFQANHPPALPGTENPVQGIVVLPQDPNLPNRYGSLDSTVNIFRERQEALEAQELRERNTRNAKMQCYSHCKFLGACGLLVVTIGVMTTIVLKATHQI